MVFKNLKLYDSDLLSKQLEAFSDMTLATELSQMFGAGVLTASKNFYRQKSDDTVVDFDAASLKYLKYHDRAELKKIADGFLPAMLVWADKAKDVFTSEDRALAAERLLEFSSSIYAASGDDLSWVKSLGISRFLSLTFALEVVNALNSLSVDDKRISLILTPDGREHLTSVALDNEADILKGVEVSLNKSLGDAASSASAILIQQSVADVMSLALSDLASPVKASDLILAVALSKLVFAREGTKVFQDAAQDMIKIAFNSFSKIVSGNGSHLNNPDASTKLKLLNLAMTSVLLILQEQITMTVGESESKEDASNLFDHVLVDDSGKLKITDSMPNSFAMVEGLTAPGSASSDGVLSGPVDLEEVFREAEKGTSGLKKLIMGKINKAIDDDSKGLTGSVDEFKKLDDPATALSTKATLNPPFLKTATASSGSKTYNSHAKLDDIAKGYAAVITKAFPTDVEGVTTFNKLQVGVKSFVKAKYVVKRITTDFNNLMSKHSKFLGSDKPEDHGQAQAAPMIETAMAILKTLSRTQLVAFNIVSDLCSINVWAKRLACGFAVLAHRNGFEYARRNSGWIKFKPFFSFEDWYNVQLEILGISSGAFDFGNLATVSGSKITDSRMEALILSGMPVRAWYSSSGSRMSSENLKRSLRIACLLDFIRLGFHTSVKFDLFRSISFYYTIEDQIPSMETLENIMIQRDESDFSIHKIRLILENDGLVAESMYKIDSIYLDPQGAAECWENSTVMIHTAINHANFLLPDEKGGAVIDAPNSSLAGRRVLCKEDFQLMRAVIVMDLLKLTALMDKLVPAALGKKVVDTLLPIYQVSHELFSGDYSYGYDLTSLGTWTADEIERSLERVLRGFESIKEEYEECPIGAVADFYRYLCVKAPSGAMKGLSIFPQLKPYVDPKLFSVTEFNTGSRDGHIVTEIRNSQINMTMSNNHKAAVRQGDLAVVLDLIDTISENTNLDPISVVPAWFEESHSGPKFLRRLADLIQINKVGNSMWFSRDKVFNTVVTKLEEDILSNAYKGSGGVDTNLIGANAVAFLSKLLFTTKTFSGLERIYPLNMKDKVLYDTTGLRIDTDLQGLGVRYEFTKNPFLSFASFFDEFRIEATVHKMEPYKPYAAAISKPVGGFPLVEDALVKSTNLNRVVKNGAINLAPTLLADQVCKVDLPVKVDPTTGDYECEAFFFHLSAPRARLEDARLVSATYEIDWAVLYNAHVANAAFALLFDNEFEKSRKSGRPFMQTDACLYKLCDYVKSLVSEDYLTIEAEKQLITKYVSKISALTLGSIADLEYEVENFVNNAIWMSVAAARLDTAAVVNLSPLYAWKRCLKTNEHRILQINLNKVNSIKLSEL